MNAAPESGGSGTETLILDRPEKANALSAELVETLIERVAAVERSGAKVLAFRGNGRNFSAGFDFGGFEEQSEADLLQRFVRIETLLQAVARSPRVTVGFAHGRNFGAGVDLFAACRWRIAAPGTTFRMPGLAFGIVLGTARFAAIVGRERAAAILGNLQTFDAERAEAIGFVHRIVPQEEWPRVLEEHAAQPPPASILPADSAEALARVLGRNTDADDMAELVRSASVPGLKERIRAYIAAR